MNNVKYSRDFFKSIPDYSKNIFLTFLFQNDKIYYARLVLVNVILIV